MFKKLKKKKAEKKKEKKKKEKKVSALKQIRIKIRQTNLDIRKAERQKDDQYHSLRSRIKANDKILENYEKRVMKFSKAISSYAKKMNKKVLGETTKVLRVLFDNDDVYNEAVKEFENKFNGMSSSLAEYKTFMEKKVIPHLQEMRSGLELIEKQLYMRENQKLKFEEFEQRRKKVLATLNTPEGNTEENEEVHKQLADRVRYEKRNFREDNINAKKRMLKILQEKAEGRPGLMGNCFDAIDATLEGFLKGLGEVSAEMSRLEKDIFEEWSRITPENMVFGKYYRPFGIPNFGNTCYVNSVVQMLACNPLFAKFVWASIQGISNENNLLYLLAVLMFEGHEKKYRARKFLDLCVEKEIAIPVGQQHDAFKFIVSLFQTLEKASGSRMTDFEWGTLSFITCSNCSFEEQDEYDEKVEYVLKMKEDCIRKYFSSERTKHRMEDEQCKQCFEESLFMDDRIQTYPKCAIIQLDRDRPNDMTIKIDPSFIVETEQDAFEYRLHSLVIHMGEDWRGSDISSGHYITAVKKDEEMWFLLNDSRVATVQYKETIQPMLGETKKGLIGSRCMMAMYIRSDVAIEENEPSPSSSNTQHHYHEAQGNSNMGGSGSQQRGGGNQKEFYVSVSHPEAKVMEGEEERHGDEEQGVALYAVKSSPKNGAGEGKVVPENKNPPTVGRFSDLLAQNEQKMEDDAGTSDFNPFLDSRHTFDYEYAAKEQDEVEKPKPQQSEQDALFDDLLGQYDD